MTCDIANNFAVRVSSTARIIIFILIPWNHNPARNIQKIRSGSGTCTIVRAEVQSGTVVVFTVHHLEILVLLEIPSHL